MTTASDTTTWQGDLGQTWVREAALLDALQAGVTAVLIGRSGIRPGEAVLDVGCGPGVATRAAALAAAPGGRVTGIDISPPMIEAARRQDGTGIDYLVADAGSHPFPAAAFDRIVSQFGMMFFADSRAAFANLRRAARPGARLTFVAWAAADRNPWFGLARAAAVAELGDVPSDPDGPGPLRLRDRAATARLLEEAGWAAVGAEAVEVDLTPPGTLADLARFATRVGPAASLLRLQGADDAARDRLVARLEAAFTPFAGPRGLRLPALVNLYTATAP